MFLGWIVTAGADTPLGAVAALTAAGIRVIQAPPGLLALTRAGQSAEPGQPGVPTRAQRLASLSEAHHRHAIRTEDLSAVDLPEHGLDGSNERDPGLPDGADDDSFLAEAHRILTGG